MLITLTKVDFNDHPMVTWSYSFERETFHQEVLTHPDFQVEGQTNLKVITFAHEDYGYPVEIVRRKADGSTYASRIGYVDHSVVFDPV